MTTRAKVAVSLMLAVASVGVVWASVQESSVPPQSAKPPLRLTPAEIEMYKSAQTLIDWTPRQIQDCPFLQRLRAARGQNELVMVLEHVGQAVSLLFHDFPRIACDEEVVSEAFSRTDRGRPSNIGLRKFRYIVTPITVGDFQGFEEYRTDLKGNSVDAARLTAFFLTTSNFISTCLHLSPADQRGSRFRHFGTQRIRKRECHVVGFAQEPEKVRRICTFQVRDKCVVVLVQGVAWIDSETFQVLRIKTWLLAPRTDIGLSSQTSTVEFYPIQLSGFERMLWLPRDVTVVNCYRDHWFRNTHHYSNFKLFRVDSTIKPAE